MFRNKRIPLLVLLFAALFAVAPMAAAQDSEPTLTPFPTPVTVVVEAEPTPAPVEATPEPAPEATPGVVIIVNPPATDEPGEPNPDESEGGNTFEFFKTALTSIVSFVVGALTGLGVALKVFSSLKSDQNTLMSIERLVDFAARVTNNPNLKPSLYQTGVGLSDAGQVLQEVSDGRPNVPTIPTDARAYSNEPMPPIPPKRE